MDPVTALLFYFPLVSIVQGTLVILYGSRARAAGAVPVCLSSIDVHRTDDKIKTLRLTDGHSFTLR